MSVGSNDALPHTVTLKDGSMVLVRRAGPEDFKMLFHMFSALSDDTMFRRFLRAQMNLTREDAEEMLRLDDADVTSLIAIAAKDDVEQAVGEARYVTDPTGKVAEAAVVVSDEWQNRGLGSALFTDLLAEAKRRGLARVFAYFDVENKSIVHLGQKFGFRLASKDRGTDYSVMKAEIIP